MYAICCQGRNGFLRRFEIKDDPDKPGEFLVSLDFDPCNYLTFGILEECEFLRDTLIYFNDFDEFIYVKV